MFYVQVSNMSLEFRNFLLQRRGHQLEPDLSEEVSARLRLGSGSNGLLRRKISILETKEKICSGKEKDKRTDDLLELTEVLFLVLIRIRDMFLNKLTYWRLGMSIWRKSGLRTAFSHWLYWSLMVCKDGLKDQVNVQQMCIDIIVTYLGIHWVLFRIFF